MPEEYQEAVFNSYKRRKDNAELSTLLSIPTTTKLRRECLNTFKKRFTSTDADILATFFDADKLDADFYKILMDSEPDDYKALLNHLQEKTDRTDEKNSDLLAWLIDFNPRPSILFYKLNSPDERPPRPGDNPRKVPSPSGDSRFLSRIKTWHLILAFTLLLICSGGTYIFVNPQRCMYWTGDHYERISCDQDTISSAIAYNEKMAEIRKITKEDTLTKNSVGKVWYFVVEKNEADFFTASGEYPLDRKRMLRPMSNYILKKYVLDKDKSSSRE